jgi:uncharacterized protein YggU (UPF0235/DUF167 family)
MIQDTGAKERRKPILSICRKWDAEVKEVMDGWQDIPISDVGGIANGTFARILAAPMSVDRSSIELISSQRSSRMEFRIAGRVHARLAGS